MDNAMIERSVRTRRRFASTRPDVDARAQTRKDTGVTAARGGSRSIDRVVRRNESACGRDKDRMDWVGVVGARVGFSAIAAPTRAAADAILQREYPQGVWREARPWRCFAN